MAVFLKELITFWWRVKADLIISGANYCTVDLNLFRCPVKNVE